MTSNQSILMTERGTTPDTPPSTKWRWYFKSDGLYIVDDAGVETGPMEESGAGFADTDPLKADVYNDSGGAIATEKVVYFSGHDAGNDVPEISLADRDAIGTLPVSGITQAQINNAATGEIITYGLATYPTTGMTAGDILYADSTAGDLTDTKPTSGLLQEVAVVVEVGATGAGRIFVSPKHIQDLDAINIGVHAENLGDIGLTSTTSTTGVDVANTSFSYTVINGELLVTYYNLQTVGNTGDDCRLRIVAGAVTGAWVSLSRGPTLREPMTITQKLSGVSTGSQTIKLQISATAGTVTVDSVGGSAHDVLASIVDT